MHVRFDFCESSSNVVKLTHSVLLIDEVKSLLDAPRLEKSICTLFLMPGKGNSIMWHKHIHVAQKIKTHVHVPRDGAVEVDIFTVYKVYIKSFHCL